VTACLEGKSLIGNYDDCVHEYAEITRCLFRIASAVLLARYPELLNRIEEARGSCEKARSAMYEHGKNCRSCKRLFQASL
jgi:hypothetical protein